MNKSAHCIRGRPRSSSSDARLGLLCSVRTCFAMASEAGASTSNSTSGARRSAEVAAGKQVDAHCTFHDRRLCPPGAVGSRRRGTGGARRGCLQHGAQHRAAGRRERRAGSPALLARPRGVFSRLLGRVELPVAAAGAVQPVALQVLALAAEAAQLEADGAHLAPCGHPDRQVERVPVVLERARRSRQLQRVGVHQLLEIVGRRHRAQRGWLRHLWPRRFPPLLDLDGPHGGLDARAHRCAGAQRVGLDSTGRL
mmetsp:Transcript_37734/g.112061  ORF Transcript_37734/g.112061 Transcript_37734/m.112061 type:complete len:254 (-) Transcript_37734:39-800(-)